MSLTPPEGEELNLFGEWIDVFRGLLHTNYNEIAGYTEPDAQGVRMHQSTLSRVTRNPESPTPESVPRIWDAIIRIAQERDSRSDAHFQYTNFITQSLHDAFLNAGGVSSDSQLATSRYRLYAVRLYVELLQISEEKDQQIEERDTAIRLLQLKIEQVRSQKNEQIADLRKELNALRREIKRLRS